MSSNLTPAKLIPLTLVNMKEGNEEEWNCALSKKMRKQLRIKGLTSSASIDFYRYPCQSSSKMSMKKPIHLALPEDSPVALKSKFNTAHVTFLRSSFLKNVQEIIKTGLVSLKRGNNEKIRVLCLGLGNPSVDRSSLRQLAFLSALVKSMPQLSARKTFLYDPLFRKSSREFIRRQGFQLLESNKEGRYQLPMDMVTFVFLPHCPLDLAESLLCANWSLTALSRLLFFSCSVTPRSEGDALFLPRLTMLAPYRHSLRLPKEESDFEAMCVEWFNLEGAPDNFFDVLHHLPLSSRTSDVLTSDIVTTFVDDSNISSEKFANL